MPVAKRFVGTDRFRVLSRLGQGGMGAVYEVLDAEQNRRVALKTLRQLDPKALLRFKHEYRALRALDHPNLVRLGELIEHDGLWLFTMELVEGTDFLSYAHESWKPGWKASTAAPTAAGAVAAGARTARAVAATDTQDYPRLNQPRIRAAFAQLARGLMALHDTGQVHRDIKPSNVLVTGADRVVILDLGLAASIEGDPMQSSEAVGTSEYMSPEQAMGRTVGVSSDWYSAGAMLYEILTGRVPFEGDHIEVSIRKQEIDPLPPSQIAPDCPRDLEELCMRMLSIDPTSRPSARQVLDAMDVPVDPPRAHRRSQAQPIDVPFVGRAHAISTLRRAFADGCSRGAIAVRVAGASGVGKSALISHFVEQISIEHSDTIVLAGRCYHGGNVPYKALDHAIDMLATYLGKRPDEEVQALLPDEAYLIPMLFSVMRRVRPFKHLKPPQDLGANRHQLRERGFRALRALLANLSALQPLVITIDDIQWSDLDSRVLLQALTAPPQAPAFLLVISGRKDDEHPPDKWLTAEIRTIDLEPLDRDEAMALASSLIETTAARNEAMSALVESAGGYPRFIYELARYSVGKSSESGLPSDFDAVLWQRIAEFGDEGVAVLRSLAIVGRPLPQKVIAEATGIDYGAFVELLGRLGDVNLVATSGPRRDDTASTQHDRVRTAVIANTPMAARRDTHANIARALEATGVAAFYPELMVDSLAAADMPGEAAHYARLSANRAVDALAFDRAAMFFRRAMELAPDAPDATKTRTALAEALVQAGRGAAAAEHFLDLAEDADTATSVEYRRRAAEQLLISGREARGREVLFEVLRANHIEIPATARHAIRGIVWQRARARLVGAKVRVRPPSQIDDNALLRTDLCRTAAMGLGLIDPVCGAYYQALHLRHALSAGEPRRMFRALAMSAGFASAQAPTGAKRANKLLAAARKLATEIDEQSDAGLAELAEGMGALTSGHFARAVQLLDSAEGMLAQTVLVEGAQEVQWELDLARFFGLQARRITGDFSALNARVPHLLRAAIERGHELAAARLYTVSAMAALGRDNVAEARESIEHGLSLSPQTSLDLQHRWMLAARIEVDLYTGDAEMGLERIVGRWPALEQANLLRGNAVAAHFWWLRGRCALAVFAACRARGRRAELRAHIENSADRLVRLRLDWALAFGRILHAVIARDDSNEAAVRDLLLDAQTTLERGGAHLVAESVRYARGRTVVRGTAGARLEIEAIEALSTRGAKDPQRTLESMLPGFAG